MSDGQRAREQSLAVGSVTGDAVVASRDRYGHLRHLGRFELVVPNVAEERRFSATGQPSDAEDSDPGQVTDDRAVVVECGVDDDLVEIVLLHLPHLMTIAHLCAG